MFGMDEKKKDMKEGLLEKLIEHLMAMPEGDHSSSEEKEESPLSEMMSEEKPKASIEVMEIKAKPKFKLGDGTEMEDESYEDMMKRKKSEGKA